MYIPETYGSNAYAPAFAPAQTERRETLKESKPKTKTRHHITPRAKRMLLLVAVWGAAILLLVRYAIITEECRRVEQLTTELAETHAEVVQEELRLNKEINLSYVEEYATGTLGMVRPSPEQEVYITIHQSDAGEVMAPEEESGVFASMGERMLKVLEYLY